MGTAWIPDQRRAILMCIQLLAWIGKGESWSGENSGKVHDTRGRKLLWREDKEIPLVRAKEE